MTVTICLPGRCENCGEREWIRPISKNGIPLFTLCIVCLHESPPYEIPRREVEP